MATSGSIDFSLTANQVVKEALGKIGVLRAGRDPSGGQAAQALTALNLMIKTWGATGRLWLKAEGSVTLLTSTASYALTGVRQVLSVRRRTNGINTPMIELSREEYYDLSDLVTAGTPLQWYFDQQRSAKKLYIWKPPTAAIAASTTLPYTYARVIEDTDSLSNDPDVPQEWFEALVYNLAVRLAPSYGASTGVDFQLIKAQADQFYGQMTSIDQETGSLFFQPA